jgi:DNA-binding transcriptional ArsR family regulator
MLEKVPVLKKSATKQLELGLQVAYALNTMEWLDHRFNDRRSHLAARKTTPKKKRKGAKDKPIGAGGVDQRLVKALSHELREQILIILNERMASPNELAKELNEGLSQVSYHVKVLKDYECITLVKTEPRRGAVEHYYRATSRPFLSDRDWHELPLSAREGLSAGLVQSIVKDTVAALEEQTFDAREDRHLSRTSLILDEKGWRDLMSAMEAALTKVGKIHEESGKRLAKAGAVEGFTAMVAMVGIEMPDPGQKKESKTKSAKAKGRTKAKAKSKTRR